MYNTQRPHHNANTLDTKNKPLMSASASINTRTRVLTEHNQKQPGSDLITIPHHAARPRASVHQVVQ